MKRRLSYLLLINILLMSACRDSGYHQSNVILESKETQVEKREKSVDGSIKNSEFLPESVETLSNIEAIISLLDTNNYEYTTTAYSIESNKMEVLQYVFNGKIINSPYERYEVLDVKTSNPELALSFPVKEHTS